MSRVPLFDSYSGDHLDEVLRRIEDRNASETHKEADSEFLRGERSAVAEIRRILAAAMYAPREHEHHPTQANSHGFGHMATIIARSARKSS